MSFILTIPIENLQEIEYNYNLLVYNNSHNFKVFS